MWADQNKALYMDTVRPQRPKVQATTRWKQAERGTLGIALLVRPELPIEATRLVPMSTLRADRVRRVALVVDITVEGTLPSVAGTYMSHLHFGSHRNWAELRRQLRTEARPAAVLAGDMNAWGPLVRFFMPGWRRAVIGRTWPAWRPHSQVDHLQVAVRSVRWAAGCSPTRVRTTARCGPSWRSAHPRTLDPDPRRPGRRTIQVRLLVSSAKGANGAGQGAVLAFDFVGNVGVLL